MKSVHGCLAVAVFLSLGLLIDGARSTFLPVTQELCDSEFLVTASTGVRLLYSRPIAALKECRVTLNRDVSYQNRICFMITRFNLFGCEVQMLLYDGFRYPIKTYSCNDIGRSLPEPYCSSGQYLMVGIRDLDLTKTYKTRDILMEFYLVNSTSNYRPDDDTSNVQTADKSALNNSILMASVIGGVSALFLLFFLIGIAVACRRRRLQHRNQGYSTPSESQQAVTNAEQPWLNGYMLQPGLSTTGHQQATGHHPETGNPAGHQQSAGENPPPPPKEGLIPTAPPPEYDDLPPPYPGI